MPTGKLTSFGLKAVDSDKWDGNIREAIAVAGKDGQKLVLLYNAVVAKAAVDDQVTNSATANYNGGADSEAATTVVKLGFFTMKKIDKQHNGIGGLCLLAGALANHIAVFRVEGSSPALAVLIPLTTLSLVLPQFTVTTPGPTYSNLQLAFAGLLSLILFGVYIFVQTIRHREHFLPVAESDEPHDAHGSVPTTSTTVAAFVLLCAALVAVVGLAKALAPTIEAAVEAIAAPSSFVGVVIALIVLLPETGSAFRAAIRNRMQISLNLALGSALATIGLTIPAIGAVAIVLDMPMTLGLPPKEIALLALTFAVSIITMASGRATILHGTVHLVVFAAFLFLSIVP